MGNVLVLEDDPDNRQLIVLWLERRGHQVTAASSGIDAVLALSHQPIPDLAVLDIVLPDINGVAFLQQLRQDPAYSDMPVIFLTAAD